MSVAAYEAMRESRIKVNMFLEDITSAFERNDYDNIDVAVSRLYRFLFEKPIEHRAPGIKWDC